MSYMLKLEAESFTAIFPARASHGKRTCERRSMDNYTDCDFGRGLKGNFSVWGVALACKIVDSSWSDNYCYRCR